MRSKGIARDRNLDQEGYFERVLSSMTEALIVVNPDTTLRSVNRAALEMLDYKEEELIGQPVEKILLQEEDRLPACFQNIFITGVTFNIGLTFLTKKRKRIPVNFSGAAMRQDGQIVGLVGAGRDMRQIRSIIGEWEEKKTEIEEDGKKAVRMQRAMLHIMGDLEISNKEIGKANKELKKLDQLKSDFVSTVSHELRTPLTVTREAISQVLDGVCGEINKEQKQFLFMSIEGIDRLARLIENLLDISKIESHKIDLKRELVDIVSLAKEVSSSFALGFQSKGLMAKYNFPKDKIELYVDKDRIIQIFMNLMSNAIKFTPAGYIEISIVDKENVVECAVFDTGIGISDEDLPKVFSKFEQFGREFESAEKGTGLGLAISKGNIELHRGMIWAESKLGQGTKISFTLPKYSARNLFKEYVTNGLAEAIKKGAALSIIIFKVKNYDTLREKFGQDTIASIVHSLGQLIKTDLRRKSDISIKDARAILVVLPETDKKCAWATTDRLKSSFDDYLSKEGSAKEIEIDIKVASFPEDAHTEEELLNGVQLQEDIEE